MTPAEAPSGLAWAAAVPPGILREGANRVRFEASTPRVAAAPECRLTFGRDPAFPRTRNASPQVVCPACCPPDPEIDKFWDLWFHGKLFSAMQHIEKLRKRWPRCAQALCAEANVCFRIGLEREQIGEMSLAVSMAVLGDGDSHSDVGSSRELWDRGCELLVTATRLYPGWTEPPYRFARAARDWGRLGPALRAARWAVALGADDPVLWTVLADVECALAQSPRGDLSRAGRQSLVRTALVHIDHALPLLPRAVAQDEALKIKEAILAGPGSRPEPGKRAK
ncbi:MAG: hypothetical protein HY814_04365 [Candidatus Riflebacteria bacterium]|nr:hypothetical protein [Candidatus Riflebacteria bacterium]